jgi:hypothetical protein
MLSYARIRLCNILVGLLIRVLTPDLDGRGATTDAPPPEVAPDPPAAPPEPIAFRVPAMVRVARGVATARAMVQAANALSASGDDAPMGLQVHATYPDGLVVFMSMHMAEAGPEVPDDDA